MFKGHVSTTSFIIAMSHYLKNDAEITLNNDNVQPSPSYWKWILIIIVTVAIIQQLMSL